MQEITLIGRIGRKDAEVHEASTGRKFISFTVAADGRWRGETVTSWYDVLTYDVEKYERMLPYLTRGSGVAVVGELYAELEQGKDGIARCRRAVTADTIKFLPKGNATSGTTDGSVVIAKTSSPRPKAKVDDTPDDIPMGTAPVAAAPVVAAPVVTAATTDTSSVDDLPF